jgi:hypothetical protein
MMVAQEPFETSDMNQFCKLVPVVYLDGGRPQPGDFPNEGEIWWMLTPYTARLAEPGHLLSGMIEDAVRYDEHDPTSSQFQARRDSVEEIDPKDCLQLLDLGATDLEHITDVVSGGFTLEFRFRPMPGVMLRWRGNVYGPFATQCGTVRSPSGVGRATLTPMNPDMSVYQIAEAEFDSRVYNELVSVRDRVSTSPHRRSESYSLVEVEHLLLLEPGMQRALASTPKKLLLEPIDRKLVRHARQILTRKKRQDLRALLSDLELTGKELADSKDLLDAIASIRQVADKQDDALDSVTTALLKSGLLGEERIERAEKVFAEQFIQERTAELQAKVEDNLKQLRSDTRRAEAELKDLRAKLDKEHARRKLEFESELAAEGEKTRNELAAQRIALEKQKDELDRQQKLLQHNLERVTKELREAGDEVVNRFLTIAPLLGTSNAASTPVGLRPEPVLIPTTRPKPMPFSVPGFVNNPPGIRGEALKEEVFFGRFVQIVESSGFSFRPLDLQRLHMSIKCSEMTVLGGPSGTGKSSLPALYALALLGDEAGNGRPDCLMVNINPSWMDTRDLLGHLNTLERRFYPAESGLFQHLVCAQEEYAARGDSTGLYLTCLDEMNLSQIEHYFSDFMMVLERVGNERVIRCFADQVIDEDCPFSRWGQLRVSPATRFIGTVNFDETTRLLSDRFLDRVNLIRLTLASLPPISNAPREYARATGPMITLADVESWRTDRALPAELGSLLDQIRPLLARIGCPLSPRAYRGVCRYVGSATPIMTPAVAFDTQIAQRIVPKIRGLITAAQVGALDELLMTLNQSTACSFGESVPLLEEIKVNARSLGWDLEE